MNRHLILTHAWRLILVHKLRSTLSALGIVFAVVAIISMLAIADGAKWQTLKQIRQLGINNILLKSKKLTKAQEAASKGAGGLTLGDVDDIRNQVAGLSAISPLVQYKAEVVGVPRETPLAVIAATRSLQKVQGFVMAAGRFLCDQDLAGHNLVCVLGDGVALGLGANGVVGASVNIANRIYKVVGILAPRDKLSSRLQAMATRDYNNAMIIPLFTASGAAQSEHGKGRFSDVIIRANSKQDPVAVASAVKRVLERTHSGQQDYSIVVPRELLHQARKTQQMFNIVLGCIAGISLVVGGIGIMNITLASVTERTQEIGIRRAVGANHMDVARQFLLESCLLTVLGGVLGLVIGAIVAFCVGRLTGWPIRISSWSIVLAMGMSVAVGIASGMYPAVKASRLDPVEALRS